MAEWLLRMFPKSFERKYGIPWYLRLIYYWVLVLNLSKIVVIIARKHAKSTGITFGLVMYCILYEKKKFILIIGNTIDNAMTFAERLRWYLENDRNIRREYGDLTLEYIGGDYEEEDYYIRGKKTKSRKWNNKIFRCSNGVVVGVGATQKPMRGIIDLDNRPDLVIGEDIEDKRNTNTESLRNATGNWWYETVMEIGTETCQYLLVGTIPHYDAFIVTLSNNPTWKTLFLRGMITTAELRELNGKIPKKYQFQPKKSIEPVQIEEKLLDGSIKTKWRYNGKDYPFIDKETNQPYKHIVWEERYGYDYFYEKWFDAKNSEREDSFWQENFNIPRSIRNRMFNQFPTIELEVLETQFSY